MRKTTLIALIVGAVLMLVLAACGGQQTTPEQAAPTSQEEHLEDEDDQHDEDDDGHDEVAEDDHDGDAHDVSESDAAQNPLAATDESTAEGSRLYAENCAVCHGDTGLGDGVAGASLNPPPANLHEDHVQVLTDGGLFAIIHNGVEDTAMLAFGETLDENDIWHVVNFIRTYREN